MQELRVQPATHEPKNWKRAIWATVAIGLALRIATAYQSFWLDEIWSYFLAQDLESVWQVFSERRHDNNHILNTLFIAAIGEHEQVIAYRALSLVSGTLSLWWLARIGRGWSEPVALAVVVMTAFSYPMVVASAQARGYAPAILLALFAFDWARRRGFAQRRSWADAFGFWLICALGFLSHLTFLYTYLAILVWMLALTLRERSRTGWLALLRWHALPVVNLCVLYAVFYSDIVIGGGDRNSDVAVVGRQVIGSAAVATSTGAALLPATLAAIAMGVVGLGLLRRAPDRVWILFVCAIAIVPAAMLAIATPRLLYPRYFWAAVAYLYLLWAIALGALFDRGRVGRLLYVVLLAAFAIVHTAKHAEHLSTGRTNYADTLAYLEAHSDADTIQIATDHDFRNSMVLRFYARHRVAGKSIAIQPRGSWTGAGPQWYLSHSWLAGRNPPQHLTLEGDRGFTLVAHFDHGIGYGWTWYLYRNDSP